MGTCRGNRSDPSCHLRPCQGRAELSPLLGPDSKDRGALLRDSGCPAVASCPSAAEAKPWAAGSWSPPTRAEEPPVKGPGFLLDVRGPSPAAPATGVAAGAGQPGAGCGGTHRAPGPRRAGAWGWSAEEACTSQEGTYTYGVVPQDVQLLHQLCDQDVLEDSDRDGGGECQPAWVGAGGLGRGRRGPYRHTFRLAVGLQRALAVREGGVVEVDGGRLPLPLLDRGPGWAHGAAAEPPAPPSAEAPARPPTALSRRLLQ